MRIPSHIVFTTLATAAIVAAGIAINASGNSVEKNIEYLKEKGYTSISIGDVSLLCPRGTPLKREFTAIDPQGQAVEGKLCGGREDSFFNLVPNTIETHVVENQIKKPKM